MIVYDKGKLIVPKNHIDLRVELTSLLHTLWNTENMTEEELEETVRLACMTSEELRNRTVEETSGIISNMVDKFGEELAAQFLRSALNINGGDQHE